MKCKKCGQEDVDLARKGLGKDNRGRHVTHRECENRHKWHTVKRQDPADLGGCPRNGVLSLEGLQSKAEGVVIWPLSLFD
jgi:hypothetical protein